MAAILRSQLFFLYNMEDDTGKYFAAEGFKVISYETNFSRIFSQIKMAM